MLEIVAALLTIVASALAIYLAYREIRKTR